MKKSHIPDKEVLDILYNKEKKSLSYIAVKFNTSVMTVRSWLHKYNIKTRAPFNSVYAELRQTEFNDEQKSLIVGSILGGGELRIPKRGKNAYFFERRCEKQRMYLEWKRNLLKPFVQIKLDKEVEGSHTISGIDCIVRDFYKMTTIAHPYLTDLWKIFYKGNGNKILPNNIGDYLNLFVIAVWVCDDGSLVWNNIQNTYRLDIYTDNFSYETNVLLSRSLSIFFKGTIKIYSRKYKSDVKYYLSLLGKRALYDFCNQLKVFVPNCMKYKFDTYL